ncbi:hypothetical protein PAP_04525 [Palaeococcus pacificus DY20341]|uniref:Protein-glutamate methylesterase/protein-glutamine glutaminase n=1 Tax=Palaeococcus pacificus DY20341 TaxID=1343739 RepID=A0A075LT67_9EURY|nr:chemotaxis response regulator protein-glutamate methylesterase [Palaeococcus pacificus]AIF69316.1 hypothetical protein PAP_04525 [Palaeococcus pacificus DY20341]
MQIKGKTKVLVVDDSSLIRKIITDIINSDPELEVVGEASDGYEAIKLVKQLKPDVITLDIEMPKMNGLDTLRYIMKTQPTPTIMVSSLTQEGADETIKALEYGAVDFIQKPVASKLNEFRKELIKKIKEVKKVPINLLEFKSWKILQEQKKIAKTIPTAEIKKKPSIADRVVVIASSTGGPKSLLEIFPKFPKDLEAAILVVQHMPPKFTHSFASRLNRISNLEVKEAELGDIIEPGKAYIAPGGYHMEVSIRGKKPILTMNKKPKINGVRPSADPTMITAAEVFKDKTVGVVMTGMGSDGANGMTKIKETGGITIAQDETTSIVFGMPKAAIKLGVVDHVVPLSRIPNTVLSALRRLQRGG